LGEEMEQRQLRDEAMEQAEVTKQTLEIFQEWVDKPTVEKVKLLKTQMNIQQGSKNRRIFSNQTLFCATTTTTTTTTTTMPRFTTAAQELSAQMCPKMRMGMLSLPYIMKLADTEHLAIKFFIKHGIYWLLSVCGICGAVPKKMTRDRNFLQVRCSSKAAHHQRGHPNGKVWTESAKSGSFLSN
jgi:hypothetical protein